MVSEQPLIHGLRQVDLSTGSVHDIDLPSDWKERYVGGKGLGARYLYEHDSPETDPLDPDALLLFMLGPLMNAAPGEARYAAITKSPLTGTFLDSYSGGSFAERLPSSLGGRIGLCIEGRADEPVVLFLEGDTARVEPAPAIWGAATDDTDSAFGGEGVVCIGPAGERRVRFATIAADGGDHQAGRGGAGAVMGAKRLKAIVATREPDQSVPDEVEALRSAIEDRYLDSDRGRWYGSSETLETIDFANEVGALPTEGWTESRFDGASNLGIEAVRERSIGRERPSESIQGGFRVETDAGAETVPRGSLPIVLGAGLGIDDFDAVAELGQLCDQYGMDVISAGNVVAWALKAADAGIVDVDADWGDVDAVRDLLEAIATRSSPVGAALADGVEAAADRFGGTDFIPTVKSMELSAYDPRAARGMALAYATSDRGGCHRRARPIEFEVFEADVEARTLVDRVIEEQNRRAVLWSLVVDDFVGEALDDLGADLLGQLGYDVDKESLMGTGERIWTLTRCFNVREGFTRADDHLPDHFVETGSGAGGNIVTESTFESMLDQYYERRGWDAAGVPTPETLDRLEMDIEWPAHGPL